MRAAPHLKRAGWEFVKNLAWMLAVFGALGAILVFTTQLPLLGVTTFVGIFSSAMAAIVTVLALFSGAHDDKISLSGHEHHPGAPPDRGGDWAGGGWHGGGTGNGGDWDGSG